MTLLTVVLTSALLWLGPPDPWQTIEYQGVRVAVPSTWERLDNGHCALTAVQWAPPGSPPCSFRGGATFYLSATFDPAYRPGLRRDVAAWSGYVFAGEYAVVARDTDRNLVRRVLDSAHSE